MKCKYNEDCKDCDYFVEKYGFCTKYMIHVTKPSDHQCNMIKPKGL